MHAANTGALAFARRVLAALGVCLLVGALTPKAAVAHPSFAAPDWPVDCPRQQALGLECAPGAGMPTAAPAPTTEPAVSSYGAQLIPPPVRLTPRWAKSVFFVTAGLSLNLQLLIAFTPTNWGDAVPRSRQFLRGFTMPPVWDDGDGVFTNYIAHPYMGASVYLVAKHAYFTPVQAFFLATAANLGWEFILESWFERPSWPDILVTSTAGAVIGELLWWLAETVYHTPMNRVLKEILLTLLDPVGQAYRLFGSKPGYALP